MDIWFKYDLLPVHIFISFHLSIILYAELDDDDDDD